MVPTPLPQTAHGLLAPVIATVLIIDQCLSEVTPPHFNLVHTPRVSPHGGGLIILYDSRKFTSCRLLNIPTVTFYNISVRLSYDTQRSYNVMSTYRKPGYAGLSFRQEFHTVLKTMSKRKSMLIIGGDMNIRVERLNEPSSAKFLEILAEHDMRQYTCCETQNQEGTLDVCQTHFGAF